MDYWGLVATVALMELSVVAVWSCHAWGCRVWGCRYHLSSRLSGKVVRYEIEFRNKKYKLQITTSLALPISGFLNCDLDFETFTFTIIQADIKMSQAVQATLV